MNWPGRDPVEFHNPLTNGGNFVEMHNPFGSAGSAIARGWSAPNAGANAPSGGQSGTKLGRGIGTLSSVQFSRPTGLGASGSVVPYTSVMQGLKYIQSANPGSGVRQAANNFLRPQSVGSALSGSGTRSMGGSGVGSALRRQPVRNIGNLFG